MQQKKKIIILAGKGASTNILYKYLADEFDIDAVIIEQPVRMGTFIKRRVKKLGIGKVAGQILFQFIVVPLLNTFSKKRVNEILQNYNLENRQIEKSKITAVNSVNDQQCLNELVKLQPDIIVVNGTRIISKKILQSVNASFINIHAGITPKYRGVHGAYWALVNNDLENCGVTVHLVDPGIDTGNIVFQHNILHTGKDNFVTYPYLQLAAGLPGLKKAIIDQVAGNLHQQAISGESNLYYHPTLWHYLIFRLKGIK